MQLQSKRIFGESWNVIFFPTLKNKHLALSVFNLKYNNIYGIDKINNFYTLRMRPFDLFFFIIESRVYFIYIVTAKYIALFERTANSRTIG